MRKPLVLLGVILLATAFSYSPLVPSYEPRRDRMG